MQKAIAYHRVSTDRQDKSGLGLEAQQEAVSLFSEHEDYQVATHFTEIESGKKNERPQLLAVLAQCRKEKATLIIAKLDGLGRSVAFIANLMESKVQFRAVDNPHADEFYHLYKLVIVALWVLKNNVVFVIHYEEYIFLKINIIWWIKPYLIVGYCLGNIFRPPLAV